jgi:hypothetical protein
MPSIKLIEGLVKTSGVGQRAQSIEEVMHQVNTVKEGKASHLTTDYNLEQNKN